MKKILNGNEAFAYGALAAGVNFFAGYPITPSTDVYEFFEMNAAEYGVEFVKILCEYYSNDGNHSPSETAKNCSMWNDLHNKSIESVENDRK